MSGSQATRRVPGRHEPRSAGAGLRPRGRAAGAPAGARRRAAEPAAPGVVREDRGGPRDVSVSATTTEGGWGLAGLRD